MARPYCPTYGNVERVLYSAEATHARGLEQFARNIFGRFTREPHTADFYNTPNNVKHVQRERVFSTVSMLRAPELYIK